jgi:hypothetical protein
MLCILMRAELIELVPVVSCRTSACQGAAAPASDAIMSGAGLAAVQVATGQHKHEKIQPGIGLGTQGAAVLVLFSAIWQFNQIMHVVDTSSNPTMVDYALRQCCLVSWQLIIGTVHGGCVVARQAAVGGPTGAKQGLVKGLGLGYCASGQGHSPLGHSRSLTSVKSRVQTPRP